MLLRGVGIFIDCMFMMCLGVIACGWLHDVLGWYSLMWDAVLLQVWTGGL